MAFKNLAKTFASQLPSRWQNEFKRAQFNREICRGGFYTDEKEHALLDQWVADGDWVLDIGANVGRYTAKLSGIIGMRNLLERDHPVLIVKDNSVEITAFLQALNYKHRRIDSSSNRLFE